MDIKQMTIQELESYFNLVCTIQSGIIKMARANNNLNTSDVRKINERYNLLYKEIMNRIDELYEGKIKQKEKLNEEIIH